MRDITEINRLIVAAEEELARLDAGREALIVRISELHRQATLIGRTSSESAHGDNQAPVAIRSSQAEKITLFRTLFRGRDDVYPRRFESAKTGKKGYQPACRNEWVKGLCRKPRVKCSACENRVFLPVSDEVIRNHLLGRDPRDRSNREFTIGVYPLLPGDSCWFLAVDFDKTTWTEDAAAFLETCRLYSVPAALERSRSGNGGHVWIFFSEPVPALLARNLGSFILTETMERRPEIGLSSYDRFFPAQDTLPKARFGNLIALPLQKRPREQGNTLFLDETCVPYPDQWAFLSSLHCISKPEVEIIVAEATRRKRVIGIRTVIADEYDPQPWLAPPSRRRKDPPIAGPLPEQIRLILSNQIYIAKEELPPALQNSLLRLAAFQNPEFYKAQATRLSTFNKPRIISCCEDFTDHIGMPRGCLDAVVELLRSLKIEAKIIDQRVPGLPLDLHFHGHLRAEQQQAVAAMLRFDTGVLAAPTAFGKTVVAAHLIAQRNVNTLILVHRRQLLDQWISRLSSFLNLDPREIGRIGGGKREPSGMLDVAIIQSFSKKGGVDSIVDDAVADYGYLVIDECHHIPARSFEIVARQCKAKYVSGLSATVTRKDGHQPIIFMQCGPIRYHVDERTHAATRPFRHRVVVRKTGFTLPSTLADDDPPAIHRICAALIRDEDRNKMIVEDVLAAVQAKRSPVVLTERTAHLALLAEPLSSLIRNVIVLQGGMSQRQRRLQAEKVAGIADDEERIIIATGRYLGEGFDDARLDTLFLTFPLSWRGRLAQYAGRLHRLHDMKKEVIVYDYADLEVPMLARMYDRRRRGYRSIGYEIAEAEHKPGF